MKKMISAILCGMLLMAGACFAENSSEEVNLYPINIGGKLNNSYFQIEGGKWGFIDEAGQMVITPQFDVALQFDNGLLAVNIGEKWGLIDTTGKTVVEPQFEMLFQFAEGLLAVKTGEKWGLIDATGKTVVAPQFDFIGPHGIVPPYYPPYYSRKNGLVEVHIGEKWGYIDRTGRVVAMAETRYGADVLVNGEGDVVYCSDPDALKQGEDAMNAIKTTTSANELYVMGYKFEDANPQLAQAAYQEILDRFPDADAALKAIDRLDQLRAAPAPAAMTDGESDAADE